MKPLSGPVKHSFWGKLLYGLLFCLIVPVYLVFWAICLNTLSTPAIPAVPFLGLSVAGVGLALMALGMNALWVHGRGLPMNAYPPSQYVQQGVFRWFSHPIYVGFVLACLGLSLALGSGAGFWVISPIVALACTALVWGYERPDLQRRFGTKVTAPWLRLPPETDIAPSWRDRISVVLLVFAPWLVAYQVVEYIGVVPPTLNSTLPFETSLPVWGGTALPYVLVYPLVVLAPIFAKRQGVLRQFAVGGLVATVVVVPFDLTVPVVAPFREVSANTVLGDLLLLQQRFDRPITAFPAFHVIWVLLAVRLFVQSYPGKRVVFWGGGGLAVISCWTTGMHALLDVTAGIGVYFAVAARRQLWRHTLVCAENIANSWKEWRFGSARIINHGLYAGFAAAVGFLIVGFIIGPAAFWASLFVGVSIIVCAGIWGQILVGSKKLQRPFGYYGAVLGAGIGIVLTDWIFAQDVLHIGAALSVAAPWIQAIGRLRCLVQGCCHGAKTCSGNGIIYRHERSRVLQISGLGGQAIHATPVYSIISNLVIGAVLMRLLLIGAPATFIVGCYLMFNGLARFVEEAYRGELQTQVIGGLKIYQWTALISFLAGSIFTMFPSAPVGLDSFGTTPFVWIGSLLMGAFVTIAMGVDWPESNRRFSRLI